LELLDVLGCFYDPGQVGMFLWARIPDGYADSYALSDEILDKAHVFITPGGIFGSEGNRYIRISLCSDREVYVEALRRVKAQLILPQKENAAL
jgi:aspartate/methionine/tyrosine aminotransferase